MKATPAVLHVAWTEQLDRWFGAKGSVLMKAEANAPFFFETHYRIGRTGAQRNPHCGGLLRLERNRLVEMTRIRGPEGTEGAETPVTVELSPSGEGTHLRLGTPAFQTKDPEISTRMWGHWHSNTFTSKRDWREAEKAPDKQAAKILGWCRRSCMPRHLEFIIVDGNRIHGLNWKRPATASKTLSYLKILVWKTSEPVGDPDVEVKIPSSLARWVPRMMMFVPRKTKEELWGANADFNAIFANIEQMVSDAVESGVKEVLDVKTKDSHVKVLIEE
jgi:hypothetical protein